MKFFLLNKNRFISQILNIYNLKVIIVLDLILLNNHLSSESIYNILLVSKKANKIVKKCYRNQIKIINNLKKIPIKTNDFNKKETNIYKKNEWVNYIGDFENLNSYEIAIYNIYLILNLDYKKSRITISTINYFFEIYKNGIIKQLPFDCNSLILNSEKSYTLNITLFFKIYKSTDIRYKNILCISNQIKQSKVFNLMEIFLFKIKNNNQNLKSIILNDLFKE
jgi:hypothetical protein